MIARIRTALAIVAAWFVPGTATRALDFALGFEDCPAELTGADGEVKRFDVFATLTTTGDDSPLGALGWSIGMEAAGARIVAVTHEGVHVSTIWDDDGDPGTPAVDPDDHDLGVGSFFAFSELATHASDPLRPGAVSGVFLGLFGDRALQPRGTARLARLTVEATVPGEVSLRFEDGFRSQGHDPVSNLVTAASFEPRVPTFGTCTILLRTGDCAVMGERSDCNEDGIADDCQLTGNDCDGNEVPDECDPDCDADGNPDACEILLGAEDTNNNGIPDDCEDCNRNGVTDDIDIAEGTSSDCNRNGVPDECDVLPAFSLLGPVEPASEGDASVVIAADLDADGDLDIASGSYGPDTLGRLSVLWFRAAGDIDGDGQLDLVGIFWSGELEDPWYVGIYWGTGGGAFLPLETHHVVDDAATASLVDMDGDGRLDIVTVNRGPSPIGVPQNGYFSVSILRNTGARTFAPPAVFAGFERGWSGLGFGLGPTNIAAGDIDGDGDPDLAFAIALGGGDGFFVVENAGGELVEATFYPWSGALTRLVLGNFVDDESLDLAVAGALGQGEQVALFVGEGDGTFGFTQKLQTGAAGFLVSDDFDGNGSLDLAAVGVQFPPELNVVRNAGRGIFIKPDPFPVDFFVDKLAVGDLDGDGAPDLLGSGNDSSAVFFNRTSPGASPDADHDGIPDECPLALPRFRRGDINGDGEVPGATADIVFLANFLFLGGSPPPCKAAADVNGDGAVPGSTTDIIYLANFLFLGGEQPPAPGPRECGAGSEADALLGCETPSENCR